MEKKPVVLIDCMNLAYRAHFAYGNLATKDGNPTGVIYGFLRMMQDVKDKESCNLIFCWEGTFFRNEEGIRVKKTWRKDFQPKVYKAGREKNPERKLIYQQANKVMPLLETLGHHQVCIPTLEADDVIGILSKKLSSHPQVSEVRILSSDRDFFQLINEKVKVYRPERNHKIKIYTEKNVLKEFKVSPSDWAKYRAFCGDKSDKYTGIPGVGPVKAVQLVNAGMDPGVSWNKLDKQVRRQFKNLKPHWEAANTCWVLSYIPRSKRYRFFSVEAQKELVKQLSSLKELGRTFNKSAYKKKLHEFTQVCARYEFNSILADRRRYFDDVKIY